MDTNNCVGMMESQLVSEFMSKTGAKPKDAVSCLKTWAWDLKRALTDYNDTYTVEHENETTDDANDRISNNIDYQSLMRQQKRSQYKECDPPDLVDYNKHFSEREEMDFSDAFPFTVRRPQAVHSPDHTFILPNISKYSDKFRIILLENLVDDYVTTRLSEEGLLNWWLMLGIACKQWVIATKGDGNCLLHAASIGMWGIHDKKLILRTMLYNLFRNEPIKEVLFRRWRYQEAQTYVESGLYYVEGEWQREWNQQVQFTAPTPRMDQNNTDKSGKSCSKPKAAYEALTEIHILGLAHILRRPIIVISPTMLRNNVGEAFAPIKFGGIYLPFEIEPSNRNRGPLVLAYNSSHFSALVSMETDNDFPPAVIPLTDSNGVLLPIQFRYDPGVNFNWETYDGVSDRSTLSDSDAYTLLKTYMDVSYVSAYGLCDEEIGDEFTDEEYESRFGESEISVQHIKGNFPNGNSNNNNNNNNKIEDNNATTNKRKTTIQLQTVAKQFGSIGKNMTEKIKRNINKIGGKIPPKKTIPKCYGVSDAQYLCAKLRGTRLDYQEQMVNDYVTSAYRRYAQDMLFRSQTDYNIVTGCINKNCNSYSAKSKYLCNPCIGKEFDLETKSYLSTGPRYNTGKSKFYAQADAEAHHSVQNLKTVRGLKELDTSMYLHNSTFYRDVLPQIVQPSDSEKGISKKAKIPVVLVDPRQTSEKTQQIYETTPCRGPACTYYGSSKTDFFCSKCKILNDLPPRTTTCTSVKNSKTTDI